MYSNSNANKNIYQTCNLDNISDQMVLYGYKHHALWDQRPIKGSQQAVNVIYSDDKDDSVISVISVISSWNVDSVCIQPLKYSNTVL